MMLLSLLLTIVGTTPGADIGPNRLVELRKPGLPTDPVPVLTDLVVLSDPEPQKAKGWGTVPPGSRAIVRADEQLVPERGRYRKVRLVGGVRSSEEVWVLADDLAEIPPPVAVAEGEASPARPSVEDAAREQRQRVIERRREARAGRRAVQAAAGDAQARIAAQNAAAYQQNVVAPMQAAPYLQEAARQQRLVDQLSSYVSINY